MLRGWFCILVAYATVLTSKDPEDAITNVLKGLSLVSHEDFAKLFKDFEIILKNLLLNMNLEDTLMDQIVEVMNTNSHAVHVVLVVGPVDVFVDAPR